jgi:hypothetical protein
MLPTNLTGQAKESCTKWKVAAGSTSVRRIITTRCGSYLLPQRGKEGIDASVGCIPVG